MKKLVVHCKIEKFDVYVGRPSDFGNPFSHLNGTLAEFKVATRDEAVASYAAWIVSQPKFIERVRKELKGKVLGCWCAGKEGLSLEDKFICHGQILAKIANDG